MSEFELDPASQTNQQVAASVPTPIIRVAHLSNSPKLTTSTTFAVASISLTDPSTSTPVEDPVVLRQQELDQLFTSGAVLKLLRAGEKIKCLDRNSISIEIQSVWPLIPTRIVRYMTSQSSDRTLLCVQNIYEAFWKQMSLCLSIYDECEQQAVTHPDAKNIKKLNDVRFREYQLIKRLDREVRETITGTRSLTSTYRDDTKFSGAVEVLIKNVSAKLIEFDRLIKSTFEQSSRVYGSGHIPIKHYSPALSFLPREFTTSCSPLDSSIMSTPLVATSLHKTPWDL